MNLDLSSSRLACDRPAAGGSGPGLEPSDGHQASMVPVGRSVSPSVTGHRWPRSAAGRHHGGLVAVAGFQAGSRTSSSRSVAREPGRREVQVHRPSDFHWRITRYPSANSENRLISEAGPTKSAVAHMSAHIRLGPTTVIDPERSTKVPVAGL